MAGVCPLRMFQESPIEPLRARPTAPRRDPDTGRAKPCQAAAPAMMGVGDGADDAAYAAGDEAGAAGCSGSGALAAGLKADIGRRPWGPPADLFQRALLGMRPAAGPGDRFGKDAPAAPDNDTSDRRVVARPPGPGSRECQRPQEKAAVMAPAHSNTTVRRPFRKTRPSAWAVTARARTRASMSRPSATIRSGVARWSTGSASWAMIGPSSRSAVT